MPATIVTSPATPTSHSRQPSKPGKAQVVETGVLGRMRALKARLRNALWGPPKKRPRIDLIMEQLNRGAVTCREEYEHLRGIRLENRIEVTQPLVLISQIQRSGGTLLSQLFDMHPQCHAHPYELFIGYPKKMHWPVLNLQGSAEEWFRILFEHPVMNSFQKGYTKHGRGTEEEMERFPFIFLPSLEKALFERCVEARQIRSQRDIFNCYMTSYFNAWLDNHNLYTGPKRIITAFVPRMGMNSSNLEAFFTTYPDGRLLSLLRDPRSWFVSARKHKPDVYGDLDTAIELWLSSTQATLAAKDHYGDRVTVLTFEDLLTDTEGTMRLVASVVGIDFLPSLLTPTFNGFPIKADSSFQVKTHGVIKDPLTRYREQLTSAEIGRIQERAFDVYQQALRVVDRPAAAVA